MDRTFKDLRTPSSKDDAFELSWGERFDESGVSWDELLRSQRVLIVSEAGAGKTHECESKARELYARGEPAFFLSLESVASAANPLFAHVSDRIGALAQERLAAELDSSTWTPTEVATLLSGRELAPKAATDMAQLLADRLDDLQELMLRDTGPRAAWAMVDDENTLRPAIARELEVAARKAYTVDQEAVTADGKETDIRLRAVSGYQATIELKIGEKKRSARELCDTIDDQLVKKYMAHRDARTGCLVVSVSDPGRHWQHPATGERLDRLGLQTLLQAKADVAQQQLGGEARVLARVLDLVPRLSTEK